MQTPFRRRIRFEAPLMAVLIAGLAATGTNAGTGQCEASSGTVRTALLELFTSEGCSSCPPADRWLSQLPAGGLAPEKVVPLAFHVDYWDYIGWADRFASEAWSRRQREAVVRQGSRTVFTPQVMLNGRNFPHWRSADGLPDALKSLRANTATAELRLSLVAEGTRRWRVHASGEVRDTPAALYLALFENNLSTEVARGENAGRRLRHDFVVRELVGPMPIDASGTIKHFGALTVADEIKLGDAGVAAFIQARNGEVLQALSLPLCGV